MYLLENTKLANLILWHKLKLLGSKAKTTTYHVPFIILVYSGMEGDVCIPYSYAPASYNTSGQHRDSIAGTIMQHQVNA